MEALVKKAKRVLDETAPAAFVKHGSFRGFKLIAEGKPVGNMLGGLTKRLDEYVFSAGSLPWYKTKKCTGDTQWKGPGCGRRRGKAVDAQRGGPIESLVNNETNTPS